MEIETTVTLADKKREMHENTKGKARTMSAHTAEKNEKKREADFKPGDKEIV